MAAAAAVGARLAALSAARPRLVKQQMLACCAQRANLGLMGEKQSTRCRLSLARSMKKLYRFSHVSAVSAVQHTGAAARQRA